MGSTGSGKTGVAIEIAQEINAEIISADSRAIYKGMDIGTAKPKTSEMQGVPHFGINLVEPGERFTVSDWKDYAEEKIEEITITISAAGDCSAGNVRNRNDAGTSEGYFYF